MTLTVIPAEAAGRPKKIDWKLITELPVGFPAPTPLRSWNGMV